MNEVLMAEDVLRPYGITLYYKGCEYLRDAIILHWHQPNLIPGQLIQLVANTSKRRTLTRWMRLANCS